MEWHAADGSVMTQDQWNAQAAGDAPPAEHPTPEPATTPAAAPVTQGDGDNATE
jgi:hypothetical protein